MMINASQRNCHRRYLGSKATGSKTPNDCTDQKLAFTDQFSLQAHLHIGKKS